MAEVTEKRPTDLNPAQLLKLSISTAELIVKTQRYGDLESCIEDCKAILEDHWDDDGYQLAKRFEDKHYDITTMLVEELDVVSHDANDLLKKSVKEWVIANDVKLSLSVGDKVIFDAWRKNNETGEIMKLYPETAQYGVWCESLEKPKGSTHYMINFEKIKETIPHNA